MMVVQSRIHLADLAAALFSAVKKNNINAVEPLLKSENPTLVNMQDAKTGNTALHYAAFNGNARMVEMLLQHGAKVTTKNNENKAPIQLLEEIKNKWECVKVFVNHKTDAADNGEYGQILLHAVNKGNYDIAKKLLEAGARQTWSRRGLTLLHIAVILHRADLIALLVSFGACIDVRDEQGRTPTQLATEKGAYACVMALAGKYDKNFADQEQAAKEAEKQRIAEEAEKQLQTEELEKVRALEAKEAEEKEWLQSAMDGKLNRQDFKRKANKVHLVEGVKKINNREERQKKLWNLLDSGSKGGSLLRIRRLLAKPSVTNKSTLHDVAQELEASIRQDRRVYIDPATKLSLGCDEKLKKDLQKSFKFLYSSLFQPPQAQIAPASDADTPPPYAPRITYGSGAVG